MSFHIGTSDNTHVFQSRTDDRVSITIDMYLFDICIAVLPSEQFANFKCFARYLPILAISFHSVRFVTFESLRERKSTFLSSSVSS